MSRIHRSIFVSAWLIGSVASLSLGPQRWKKDVVLPWLATQTRATEHLSLVRVRGPAGEAEKAGFASRLNPPSVMPGTDGELRGRNAIDQEPTAVSMQSLAGHNMEFAGRLSNDTIADALILAQSPLNASGSPTQKEEIDNGAETPGHTHNQHLAKNLRGTSQAVLNRDSAKTAWNDIGPLTADTGLDYVDFSLCNVRVHSNLGGAGPDSGEESLRFYKVATAGRGQSIDLVVTTNSSYKARDSGLNGLISGDGCFGLVNMKSPANGYREVELLFSFYHSGTNISVALNKFYMTLADVDSGNTVTEQLIFLSKVHDIYYVPDHSMAIEGSLYGDADLTISSAVFGDGADNPKDPLNLTADHQMHSVMVEYREQAQWKFKWALSGGKGGRNFVFAGRSNLLDPKNMPTTTTRGKSGDKTTSTTTTCPHPRSCQIFADPHVSGFDNLDNQGPTYLAFYRGREQDVQAGGGQLRMHTFDLRPVDVDALDTGDFWLVKSERVFIQARFRLSGEFIPDRSAIGAIAVGGPFLSNRTLLVEPLDGQVSIEGLQIPRTWSDPAQEIFVQQASDEDLELDLPMAVKLKIRRFPKHIDVKITMPPIPGGVDGECGNYDGIAENDGDDEVRERMGRITVDDRMLLFPTKFDAAFENRLEQGPTEEDYEAVASLRDEAAMEVFVRRVLATENKTVPPEKQSELEGFLPWYSGTLAIQSLEKLKDELLKQSWVQNAVAAGGSAADTIARSTALHGQSNREEGSSYTGGHSECSDCLVFGASRVLSFSAFRKHAAQHPNREALFRVEDWQKQENRQTIVEEGTYWLVKTQDVQIQGRFWIPWKNSTLPFLGLGALAIGGPFLHGNKLFIRNGEVSWNQQKILPSSPSTFLNNFVTAKYTGNTLSATGADVKEGLQFIFPNGITLTVTQHHGMLDARLHMCQSQLRAGTAEGQCGSFEAGVHEATVGTSTANAKLQKNEMIFPWVVPQG